MVTDKVKVLPKSLANKIAAGEVVERPASVVKELLENAIDASATAIRVAIKGGGVAEISVYDNGRGMSKKDVRLTVVRFATSKLKSEKSLFEIGSLGFRGEALSSICAVAKVNVISAQMDGKGYFVESEGGEVVLEDDVVMDRGTVVKVRDLFYNVPARRKFLKSKLSENRACWEVIRRYAVAYPGIGFDVNIDGKEVLNVNAEKRGDRQRKVIKEPWVDGSVYIESEPSASEGEACVKGHLMKTEEVGKGRPTQWFFVNRRPVEDARVKFVVKEAYESIAKRGSPGFVLFLEIPFAGVDVNVHPRKTEVKFRNADAVYKTIYQTVKKLIEKERTGWGVLGKERQNGISKDDGKNVGTSLGSVAREAGTLYGGHKVSPQQVKIAMSFSEQVVKREEIPFTEKDASEGEWSIGGGVPIVQVKNAYLLTADLDGITVIDQHAAAERVLYEEVLRGISGRGVAKQALLVPIDVDADTSLLGKNWRKEFEKLGIAAELFGEDTIRIRALPVGVSQKTGKQLFIDLLSAEIAENKNALQAQKETVAATIACHSAIKFGDKLSDADIRKLVTRLSKCNNPFSCPHGRPIMYRIPYSKLEALFERH